MLTPFPSATAFALALGARLTLRGLTLRRNPWTFGVRGSHPHLRYSCQHSHFRCLQRHSHAAFAGLRNAPLPRSGVRNQESGWTRPTGVETLQHPADLDVVGDPSLSHDFLGIAEIDAVAQPQLRLVTAADRDRQISPILRRRIALLGEALGEVGADRFARPAELIRQSKLLDPRQRQAGFVDLQRQPISAPKDLEILDPLDPLSHQSQPFLAPDSWFLTPEHPQLRCVA